MTDERRGTNGQHDPARARREQESRWPEIRRLADVLSRIVEENHLSPKIASLYRDRK